MFFFSERKALENQYYEWIKENGIADQPNSVMAFLDIHGIINHKKAREKAGVNKLYPKNNFDRITENEEALAKWVLDTYCCVPPDMPCNSNCDKDCGECFKEWLQKEVQDEL